MEEEMREVLMQSSSYARHICSGDTVEQCDYS